MSNRIPEHIVSILKKRDHHALLFQYYDKRLSDYLDKVNIKIPYSNNNLESITKSPVAGDTVKQIDDALIERDKKGCLKW